MRQGAVERVDEGVLGVVEQGLEQLEADGVGVLGEDGVEVAVEVLEGHVGQGDVRVGELGAKVFEGIGDVVAAVGFDGGARRRSRRGAGAGRRRGACSAP